MAKDKSQVRTVTRREDVLCTAREHIVAAASLLRPLSSEFERVSWILEDTLMYIDEAQAAYEEEVSSTAGPHAAQGLEKQIEKSDKQVTAGQ